MGDYLENDQPGALPSFESIVGASVTLEKVAPKHHDDAYDMYVNQIDDASFTYMFIEPIRDSATFESYFEMLVHSKDPYYVAIIDNDSQKMVGVFSFMRIDPKNRVIEMGGVLYSPELRKSKKATEAQYLMMQHVFEDLGYRRYEWKCDSLNEPSRNAALRLGFTFEGTFRQAIIYKHRTRDTNWFSIIDGEWPAKKARLAKWLDEGNFDADGQQIQSLSAF
ncbi:GNAT family N-acetyltransferase [Aerococcus agrisoli]|uniref:GNAT family N-acetyltransferase n=1 Tax=Aerococcus agrisoli TaxID=2487350 RepID=UPI0018F5B8B7|nr:GNAT family protein [Aerococcus agrisoli]